MSSQARFKVVPAGRRSGKTERFKRFLTKQKRSLAALHREVAQACKTQKLPVPARNTFA